MRILNRRKWDLRRGVFQAASFGLYFWRFFLGPPFQKRQKTGDFGTFAKFVIAERYRHLWSRDLQQNVFQGLHFMHILIKR